MAVSICPSLSGAPVEPDAPAGTKFSFREPVVGTPAFPIAVYDDNVGRDAVAWHWHEAFEIGCITEGAVLAEIGSRKYTLDQGDVFFINSEIMHSMRNASPGSPAVFKAVVFHGSIIGGRENSVFHQKYVLPVMKSVGLRDCVFRREEPHTGRLFSDIMDLWTSVYSEEEGYELYVRNWLSSFFQTLLAHTGGKAPDGPGDEQRLEFHRWFEPSLA